MSKQNIEFKDSGIAWIGEIPKHWGVKRLKFIIENSISGEVIDKGYWNSGNEFLYTCQKEPMFSDFDKFPENKRTRGNCLLLTRNATPYIFIPKDNAIFSNVVQKIILFKKYDKRYIKYSIQIGANSLLVNGDIIPSYNMQVWNNIYFCDIPLNEQKKIAEFLDKKCEIIDKRLSNLERKIKSLKEYKKSLISECVTKGLNPKNMEFKDSGIPWIGQIPKHWEISKIKYVAKIRNENSSFNAENDKYIGLENVAGYLNSLIETNTEYENSIQAVCKKGDILFGKLRPYLSKVIIAPFNCFCSSEFLQFINLKCYFKFFYYFLLNKNFIENVNSSTYGAKMPRANSNYIMNLNFLVPPLNEQKEIAEFLDKKCEKIDRLNENYAKQITILKEYKKSLIYECVTGKKEI
ncbi:restriction endonuclease subunit S [Campylobacter devanensis]|uniref:restriction endonuclease subunit S n=1 Tax=Campylobacter devanensis TaxID=3161138 RepID=UPI000A33B4C6|nr:restriction endonuclease subunit S [Campylobacter sp. P0132]